MTLSLTLPFPPSTNNLFMTIRAGKRTKRAPSPEAAAYVGAVRRAVEAMGVAPEPLQCDLRVVVAAWFPDRRRRDLDNLLKAPLDGLVKSRFIGDDSMVVDLRIYRAGYDKANPRLTIWIEPA